jgi:lysine 6-dehydrogenase
MIRNVLVLGGGQQGRVIAEDLATALPDRRITVADVRRPATANLPNLFYHEVDLSDREALARTIAKHDLAVGALPSRLGWDTMVAATDAKVPLVDVSFSAENPIGLDGEARAAGIAIVPDCGLAPGLSHLRVGRDAAAQGTPDEVVIMVGGVAQDRARPYGYVVTWSVDDLLEEYVRPARIVKDGQPAEVPVFSGMEHVEVEGAGTLEAFYSDGLRTLIDTMPEIRDMGEKTLRWPGHVDAIQPLLRDGRFVEEFRAKCVVDPPEDLVVLLVRVRRGADTREYTLVDRYDPATRRTAMSRTTALTTSAGAQLLASGWPAPPGVQPLERVGRDERAYEFVMAALGRHGIRFRESARPAAASGAPSPR